MIGHLTDAPDVRTNADTTSATMLVAGDRMPLPLATLVVLWLAAMTVFAQEQALGLSFIEGTQLMRHNAVLSGTAPDPWAYRLLSEWIVELTLRLGNVMHLARPTVVGYLALRAAQNVAIFGLAISYYRRLGLGPQLQAIGVVLLAWSMSHALFNSDLSVNTYFDVIAYLIAASCVTANRLWALVPLVVIGALNRDTAALIPALAVAPLLGRIVLAPRSAVSQLLHRDARRPIAVALVGLAAFGAVYLAIRKIVGPAPWPWGFSKGPAMLLTNLRDRNAYLHLPLTFSALPILAAWRWRRLPAQLRGFLLLLGAAWGTALVLMVYVAETRLFLVPIALAFIPAALYASSEGAYSRTTASARLRYGSTPVPTISMELPNGIGSAPSSRASSRETA
jgi:hypothetical protein